MRKTNQEIFRFGLYLLFPVCTLFVFNTPEILSYIPSSLDKVRQDFEEEKQRLYAIPMKREEIQKVLEQYREFKNRINSTKE
jgi:hypothetical protein